MKKLQKNKPYLVEWIDTYSYSGWHSDDEIDELTKKDIVKTRGVSLRLEK